MEKIVFVHYDDMPFDRNSILPIQNTPFTGFTKPYGGFWASREDASFGWKEWCQREEFDGFSDNHVFRFTLKDTANVVTLSTMEQFEALPKRADSELKSKYIPTPIDFEECLRQGIDAIELCWYGEEYKGVRNGNLYFALHGWDCDCILILNPDVIEQVGGDERC